MDKSYLEIRSNLKKRSRRFSKVELNLNNKKVLDIGCGDGINIEVLSYFGLNSEMYIGLDTSDSLLENAKANYPKYKFVKGSAENMPFPSDYFDLIVADSVLHHLTDFQSAVIEFKRVLKPQGELVFLEPHQTILRRILDLITISPLGELIPVIKGRKPLYEEERDLMKNWLANESKFCKLLLENNFKTITHEYTLLNQYGKHKKWAK